MTNQEKIRYLRQYQEGQRESVRLERELEVWRSRAEKITPGLGGEGGGTRSGGDRIQGAVEQLVELQEQLAGQLAALAQMRKKIEEEINGVEEPRLREILRLRYINGYTWERVAEEMNYSFRQVTRMHGDALNRFLCEKMS